MISHISNPYGVQIDEFSSLKPFLPCSYKFKKCLLKIKMEWFKIKYEKNHYLLVVNNFIH